MSLIGMTVATSLELLLLLLLLGGGGGGLKIYNAAFQIKKEKRGMIVHP